MILSDEQYDLLSYCFRNHYNNRTIRTLTRIPLPRIERERERWKLCRKICAMGYRQTCKQLYNGGKTFGRRHLEASRMDQA